jgi:hypothetical protein
MGHDLPVKLWDFKLHNLPNRDSDSSCTGSWANFMPAMLSTTTSPAHVTSAPELENAGLCNLSEQVFIIK